MDQLDLGVNNYGFIKTLEINVCVCDYCKKEKFCMSTDSSYCEYSPVSLCRDCINSLFQRYENNQPCIN